MGFGTDYSSMLHPNLSAFFAMQTWITRVDPMNPSAEPLNSNQGIFLEHAIHGFTLGGAESLGFDWPEKIGSIEEGKLADFLILDRNIFEIPIEELQQTGVEKTIVGGVVIFMLNKTEAIKQQVHRWAFLSERITAYTVPLPPNSDSSHRQTVESPETRHFAGVVQR